MSWKTRLVIALTFALLIGAMSLEATRRDVEGNPYLALGRQMTTMMTMRDTVTLIEDFRSRHRRLPKNLDEVQDKLASGLVANFRDSWDRPLHYIVHNGTFYLESYGADGRPGGRFLDADIRSDRRLGRPHISYRFLASLPEFPEMLGWTLLTTALCFYIAFSGTRKDKNLTVGTVVTLLIIGTAAAFMSGIMTMVHVYPDH